MKTKKKISKHIIISCCTVLFVLAAWYVCINVLHLKQETVFPGPLTVAKNICAENDFESTGWGRRFRPT